MAVHRAWVVSQKFRYTPSRQVMHLRSGLCLEASGEAGADARAAACRPGSAAQFWDIDYSEDNGFHKPGPERPLGHCTVVSKPKHCSSQYVLWNFITFNAIQAKQFVVL